MTYGDISLQNIVNIRVLLFPSQFLLLGVGWGEIMRLSNIDILVSRLFISQSIHMMTGGLVEHASGARKKSQKN
jgi:hypothetical protein